MEISLATMAWIASETHFDKFEIWFVNETGDEEYKFTQYATNKMEQTFSTILYSVDSSKQLCQRARNSPERFCWLLNEHCINSALSIKTELSILLSGKNRNIVLICFSLSALDVDTNIVNKLRALNFSTDEENIGNDLNRMANETNSSKEKAGFGVDSSDSIVLSPSESSSTLAEKLTMPENSNSITDTVHQGPSQSVLSPQPVLRSKDSSFLFPISQLPVTTIVSLDSLPADHFDSSMKPQAEGSNSIVYCAIYNNRKVAVKISKDSFEAQRDLETERRILTPISHPNIINIIAESRKNFIVLEFLGGGTLKSLLDKAKSESQIFEQAAELFTVNKTKRRAVLLMARDIARALHYLHDECCPDACIIHRDLKPENIGVTEDNTLKLFDFGLAICVKRPKLASDVYKMTGYTGTLRYMAPEVAQRKPYNQKVDVYSFGIIFWQMLTGKVPFKSVGKKQFISKVVDGGLRPKIPWSLSKKLSNLLTACWARDPAARPSFASILVTLDEMLADIDSTTTRAGGSSSWL